MDKRAQILLKTLIEQHINDGQPVGSRALLQHSRLNISTATIRNIMSDLEALGFVESPHTSAGRVPTHKGYRFFVDTLLTIQPLEETALQDIRTQLTTHNTQELIHTAANLLSQLTQFVGIVMVPRQKHLAFRHVEFLPLSDTRILLIMVTQDGQVQNRILFTDKPYSSVMLNRASNYFNRTFVGKTFSEACHILQNELEQMQTDMNVLMRVALTTTQESLQTEDQIVISGGHHLLGIDSLSGNMQRLRKLFEAFERRTQLLALLTNSQQAEGIAIFIGQGKWLCAV